MQGDLRGEEYVYVGDTSRLMYDETPITYRSAYSSVGEIPVTVSNSNRENENADLKDSPLQG